MSTGLFADEEDGYNLEEEVKYKLKVATPGTSPLNVSTEPEAAGGEEVDLDFSGEDVAEPNADDKPFDDTPFDAGVDADEDEDPEKYIQQLAGKLGTTLRKYSEDKGEPDFDLEKFAINSVISATHTAKMDEEDQKDIIKKIKSSGDDEKDVNVDVNVDTGSDEDETEPKSDETEVDAEEKIDEVDELYKSDPKFASDPGFEAKAERQMFEYDDLLSDAAVFGNDLEGVMGENHEEGGELKYNMFFNDIFSIYQSACELLEMDDNTVDALLSDGHGWALDHIATANSQLESVYHFLEGIEAGITEGGESNNYMFFQNLKNIRHASHEILNMDVHSVDEILCDHEWALNLIARANDDVEEVYHFLMGALDGYDEEEYSEWSEPMELQGNEPVSDELGYHLDNGIALGESVFRYGSEKFINLVNEVKKLHSKGLIKLNENDAFIVSDLTNEYVKISGDRLKIDFIFESDDESEAISENMLLMPLKKACRDKIKTETERSGKPFPSAEASGKIAQCIKSGLMGDTSWQKGQSPNKLTEAEYQGKKVEIGKPKRGGSKKFYVYVKNPKTGKVKKVSFGAKSGGGNLAVKLRDPKARKAFADRHNCEQKNDKTKPGYWACRLPRYAKLLGLSGGGRWW